MLADKEPYNTCEGDQTNSCDVALRPGADDTETESTLKESPILFKVQD
jgi:hypothetical protein